MYEFANQARINLELFANQMELRMPKFCFKSGQGQKFDFKDRLSKDTQSHTKNVYT
jgi:hypothetical protein